MPACLARPRRRLGAEDQLDVLDRRIHPDAPGVRYELLQLHIAWYISAGIQHPGVTDAVELERPDVALIDVLGHQIGAARHK